MTGALAGLRVLDLTRQMAGPYATALLADHGADVVKIESLPHGDPSRWTGLDHNDGNSPLYLMWNRGKRSVALDVRSEESRQVLHALVDWADVLVENFRPGVTERMGLGWEDVHLRNPRLIYCSVTGFGPTGPMADRPATDPLIQAMSGVLSVTGTETEGPALVGVPIADYTGAMLAMQGILLAVIARERTGEGQRVDTSLFGGLLSSLSTRLAMFWSNGDEPARHGSAHSVVVPYQVFQAKDGPLMAGTWGPGDWPKFCAAVERSDLVDDERFATNEVRVRHRAELIAELVPVFAERTIAHWTDRFREEGALLAPVLSIPQAIDHPQTQHLGLVQELPHRVLGDVKAIRSPIFLSATDASLDQPPPVLGEHTVEVLKELGFPPATIDELLDSGVALDGLTRGAEPTVDNTSWRSATA